MKIVLENFAVTTRHSVIEFSFQTIFFSLLVEGDLRYLWRKKIGFDSLLRSK